MLNTSLYWVEVRVVEVTKEPEDAGAQNLPEQTIKVATTVAACVAILRAGSDLFISGVSSSSQFPTALSH